MKKLWILTILAGMMVVTGAKADTVTLDAFSGVYPGLGGGEFTAYTSQNFLSHYVASTTYNYGGNVGFETLCIETGVDFYPGSTYYYTLGYVSQPVPPNGAGSAVKLSQGAAWLYYQFGKGLLTDFTYAYGAGRQADDNLLQAAIWAFQGNQKYGSYTPATASNNKFYADAINALGTSAAADDYTGSSVEILQMWSNYSINNPGITGEYHDPTTGLYYWNAAQNQLVLTGDTGFDPVPDGGMTVALLGLAITGLGVVNRKIRK